MQILCIIGPSGAGKSSIVTELVKRGLVVVTASATDRPPREGEMSLEHDFLSRQEFDAKVAGGTFLGTVQPFGLPYRYGLPSVKLRPGAVPLVLLRAPFVARLREFYPDTIVYQIEAPYEFAERQVGLRGEAEIGTRLQDYDAEIALGRTLADRVFVNENTTIPMLADRLAQAIAKDFLHP